MSRIGRTNEDGYGTNLKFCSDGIFPEHKIQSEEYVGENTSKDCTWAMPENTYNRTLESPSIYDLVPDRFHELECTSDKQIIVTFSATAAQEEFCQKISICSNLSSLALNRELSVAILIHTCRRELSSAHSVCPWRHNA
jgi:hypothetical protein